MKRNPRETYVSSRFRVMPPTRKVRISAMAKALFANLDTIAATTNLSTLKASYWIGEQGPEIRSS